MVDIKKALEGQGWKLERESGTAFFYNFAPWVAPKAYLHIIFKGASASALSEVGNLMRLPQSWRETLLLQNGAVIFSGAMSVYGLHASGALLNRKDVFEGLPFSIVAENRSWPPKDPERHVVIGSYDFDGTRAILDRQDGSVIAMPRKNETILNHWPDTDSWLTEELDRLSKLFDEGGRMRVSEQETLPKRLR
jgi:hypothetical protein